MVIFVSCWRPISLLALASQFLHLLCSRVLPFSQLGFTKLHDPVAQQVQNLPVNAGNIGSISGLEDPVEEGNGNLLWYSCLENPMGRGEWLVTVHEVAKNLTEHAAIHRSDHAVNFSFILKVKVKVAQSCPTLCDPMDSGQQPTRLLCPWGSLGKHTGVGCYFLLQGSPKSSVKPCVVVS